MHAPSIYQLKVRLQDSKPPIWRRLQVPGDITLYGLHRVIQTAMGGWDDSHLHGFDIGRVHYAGGPFGYDDQESWGPQSEQAVLQHLGLDAGHTFRYTYDYGDSWVHIIKVEGILPAQAGVDYPRCLAGRRAGPPEDCGGIWGYYDLLEALNDPSHERHDEMLEWLGDPWDPAWFSVDEVNARLRRILK
jgi:hypothetical protein